MNSKDQKLTAPAFDEYRKDHKLQEIHNAVRRYPGDTDQMRGEDGLERWRDGAATTNTKEPTVPSLDQKPDDLRLWVIMKDNLLHALEACEFGTSRGANSVKHSNLTGGCKAYAGGELVFLDERTVVLNGCSGRYRISTSSEMSAIEKAFRKSGYLVWSMGWNEDTNRPALFGTQDPIWVRR